MMHQQAASSHYSAAQGGSQHYQGQSMAMMGQSGQGGGVMGQRPMAPYRPSQQGEAALGTGNQCGEGRCGKPGSWGLDMRQGPRSPGWACGVSSEWAHLGGSGARGGDISTVPPGSSQQYLGQEEYYGGEQYGHGQAASEPMSQQYYPDGEARFLGICPHSPVVPSSVPAPPPAKHPESPLRVGAGLC